MWAVEVEDIVQNDATVRGSIDIKKISTRCFSRGYPLMGLSVGGRHDAAAYERQQQCQISRTCCDKEAKDPHEYEENEIRLQMTFAKKLVGALVAC